MPIHPFRPLIPNGATKLLVGTLPPETAQFYFSNSTNTRLWDILSAIDQDLPTVCIGSNALTPRQKKAILERLNLGITDIIHRYDRTNYNSTKDTHIIPIQYLNLIQTALDNNINTLLFVYNNALKWFLHSLTQEAPVRIGRLKGSGTLGRQVTPQITRRIQCILLPSPLNRGRLGETLEFKLNYYRRNILTHNNA